MKGFRVAGASISPWAFLLGMAMTMSFSAQDIAASCGWSSFSASSPVFAEAAKVEEATCEADGTCTTSDPGVAPNQQFQVQVVNESKFRVDVYWDDGRFGKVITTLNKLGDTATLNTFLGHAFFFTRHGVREGLFDLEADKPYRFETNRPGETFVLPKQAAPSPNPCQDRYSICPQEAARGSCSVTPGWMIVHCCQSCNAYMDAESLVDPKVRCTPEHLNMTEPIWKPGDLNKLFESWAKPSSDSIRELQPQVLSSPNAEFGGADGPWVMIFDNFLSSKEADALVRGGRMVGFDRSTDQGQISSASGERERIVSKSRTSSNAWCVGACEKLPEVDSVTERIEMVTKVPRTHYESFQILEYEPDQFYRMHHDSSGRKDDTPSGHRILTFFLYLSDVEDGGETYFNKLDLAVKPKKGRALIWPSVLNEKPDEWDPRMYHEAQDVIKGKKYAANHWIHLNDYITPNIWGCTGSFS